MKWRIIGFSLSFALFANSALANTTIDTYPSWNGNITSGWTFTAQTFTAPSDNVLLDYQFGITPRSVDSTLNFSIYEWSGSGQVGLALYSAVLPWTTTSTDILVSGINLLLTTGNLYGAVIDLQGYSSQSVHYESNAYPGGNGFWSVNGVSWNNFPDLDHQFRANFGSGASVPEPATMLLMGVGLAGLAGTRLRRKKM